MFWFKSCPKCHGDLYRASDTYGTYIACMQCSHYLTQADETRLELFSSKPNPRWELHFVAMAKELQV